MSEGMSCCSKVNKSKKHIKKHSWVGIQNLSNFSLEPDGFRVLKAYNIGSKNVITKRQASAYSLKQGNTEGFNIPEKETDYQKSGRLPRTE